jgi:DNA topoisomerase I
VDSAAVNKYLHEITNEHFTAKDFRTWAGTVLACTALGEFEAFESEAQAKKNVVQAIKVVATRLGNNPSVCRKCYIHPAVLDCYMSGAIVQHLKRTADLD